VHRARRDKGRTTKARLKAPVARAVLAQAARPVPAALVLAAQAQVAGAVAAVKDNGAADKEDKVDNPALSKGAVAEWAAAWVVAVDRTREAAAVVVGAEANVAVADLVEVVAASAAAAEVLVAVAEANVAVDSVAAAEAVGSAAVAAVAAAGEVVDETTSAPRLPHHHRADRRHGSGARRIRL
jgi:hypothetical protein